MSTHSGDDPRAHFDSIRQVNPYGEEFWSARDLMPLLGYGSWRRFDETVERAKAACRNLGQDDADHFAGAGKMVTIGSKTERRVEDYALSRLACYLVARNSARVDDATCLPTSAHEAQHAYQQTQQKRRT
jgi:DNA-damage-inducible protein D